MTKTLLAEKVTYAYTKGKRSVLNEVSFQIDEGEIVGLRGPSGYGKSTLARILCGQLSLQSGLVTWDGAPIKEVLRQSKGKPSPIQLIYQHPELAVNPRWKMRKTVYEAWNVSDEVLSHAGIKQEWLERYPLELSGGELQRFCVVRALAPTSRILICDEISTMLDTITQAKIWQILTQHADNTGCGLLVISHNDALLSKVCSRIVSIEDLQQG